jgi:hypothetical protein
MVRRVLLVLLDRQVRRDHKDRRAQWVRKDFRV